MKIFLIILAVIVGLIALILFIPVEARFSYKEKKIFYIVKYAFYSIIGSDLKKKPKKEKKPEKEKKPKKVKEKKVKKKKSEKAVENNVNSAETESHAATVCDSLGETEETIVTENKEQDKNADKKEEKAETDKSETNLSDKISFFLDIWSVGKKPLRKICKGFHFSKLYLDIKVADEDAYKCAMNYGRMCFAVYNSLELLNEIFTVKPEHIDVYAAFGEEKSAYNVSFKVRFRLGTAVGAAIAFLWAYYFRIHRPKVKKRKIRRKNIKKMRKNKMSVRKTA